MSKLPAKATVCYFDFSESHIQWNFLLITIVLFLIPTRQVQSTCYCSGFSKFVPVSKIFIQRQNTSKVFSNVTTTLFLDKLYVPKQTVRTVPKMGLLAVLPFLGKFSLNLRKSLYKLVSKSLTQCNIKVIFQSKNRLNSLLKLKDSIPLFFHCHLVYKFQCSNCDNTYHGEIERHLKVRAGENISTSPLTEKRSINNKKFPVKDHCFCQVACVHLMILPS